MRTQHAHQRAREPHDVMSHDVHEMFCPAVVAENCRAHGLALAVAPKTSVRSVREGARSSKSAKRHVSLNRATPATFQVSRRGVPFRQDQHAGVESGRATRALERVPCQVPEQRLRVNVHLLFVFEVHGLQVHLLLPQQKAHP